MKKRITCLFLILTMISLLNITAFAGYEVQEVENSGVTATVAGDGQYLSVSYPGAETGKFYLLVVQEGTDLPTKDSIKYINQAEAGKDGVAGVTFSTVFPDSANLDSAKTYNIILYSNDDVMKGTVVATFTYTGGKLMKGDVDGNKRVTSRDALWVLQNAVGRRDFTPEQTEAANVDGSKSVTSRDALWILQASVGRRTL